MSSNRSSKEKQIRRMLAHNIRYLAELAQLPLNTVADKSKLSRSQLYNLLGARSAANLDTLTRLSKTLGVEPYQLLEGWW